MASHRIRAGYPRPISYGTKARRNRGVEKLLTGQEIVNRSENDGEGLTSQQVTFDGQRFHLNAAGMGGK